MNEVLNVKNETNETLDMIAQTASRITGLGLIPSDHGKCAIIRLRRLQEIARFLGDLAEGLDAADLNRMDLALRRSQRLNREAGR